VAGGILFFVRPCTVLHASQNIVNVISCKVFETCLPNLRQQCTMGRMNFSHFEVNRSKVKVMVEYSMLETVLLAFTTPLGGTYLTSNYIHLVFLLLLSDLHPVMTGENFFFSLTCSHRVPHRGRLSFYLYIFKHSRPFNVNHRPDWLESQQFSELSIFLYLMYRLFSSDAGKLQNRYSYLQGCFHSTTSISLQLNIVSST